MKVAYDMSLMRPACPLVAATLLADITVPDKFDVKHWVLRPTKHMRVYETTDHQLKQLITLTVMHSRFHNEEKLE